MTLKLQEEESSDSIVHNQWDLSFVGLSIDDRGDAAIEFARNNSKKTIQIDYDADDMLLKFSDRVSMIDDIDDDFKFLDGLNILIEATTVNFVELLLVLKQAKLNSCAVSILYLEPKSYTRKRESLIIHKREFQLSNDTPGFYPIPGFINSLNKKKNQKTVFIAGYESERIVRAIEENSLSLASSDLIFGVPAFKAGWEMNSFANNITVLKEERFLGDLFFSSANNPGTTLDILNDIYSSLDENEEMFIAPLGPKPGGIATAIFLIEHEDVNVFYDHPSKKEKRTMEVNKWHLYDITY